MNGPVLGVPSLKSLPRLYFFLPIMPLFLTARDRHIVAWILFFVGALMTAGGLLGVWVQGLFYEGGFPTPATFGEIRLAFTLPAAVTTLGSLMVGGVLFASSITASWSPRRRLLVFVCFGGLVLLGCAVCGHLAAARVERILN